MIKRVNVLSFFLILLVASFLRFYQINNIPPSLNWDEVSIGYNAYSILKTSKDEWGNFMPLNFRAFGDYKLPLYIYLDVPFVAIFGLNELAVRLPSILSGIGVVILTFLVVRELTKSIYLAFWGMFISAILPWLITFSRIALEANLALFLTTASFYIFLKAQKKGIFLPLSAVLLGLSAFSYNSSRVLIIPILIIGLVFLFKMVKKNYAILTLIILIVFISAAFFQAATIDSSARYRWTTILDEGAITKINQLRGLSHLSPILNKILYNKAGYSITESLKNYFSHFNPNFLFEGGGSNYQFSIPGSGQIYLLMLPLILLGLWQMVQQRKNWQLFILGWFLVAPIPGAITRDAPHALRSIFLTIPLVLCAVIGIKRIKEHLAAKIFHPLSAILILLLVINTWIFWQNYAGNYRKNYSWAWQYGYKQAVNFVNNHQDDYKRIIFTKNYGEPHEFLLFYLKINPHEYQTDKNLIRYKRSDWFWVDKFEKYEFVNDWEIKDKILGAKNTLLVTSPNNYPANSRVLETINFLDGKKDFEIVEVN